MVDFKLTNAYSPTLFTTDGYQLVVMPMMTDEVKGKSKRLNKPKRSPQAEAVAEAKAEAVTEAEAKPKRNRRETK